MNASDFTTDCPGQLVAIPEGVQAFVPDPLPPGEFDQRAVSEHLIEAAAALGELRGVGSRLPNPHLLIGPLRYREAILSSKLEGTFTTVDKLAAEEARDPKRPISDQAAWEVRNYIVALEIGLDQLDELPVSGRLIRKVHERLMTGVRGHDQTPGEFRRMQNFIGDETEGIKNARFVPPPVDAMNRCLSDMESYIHQEGDLHALVNLAIIHYQFETIHPFRDGNGRVGRLLISLLLCDWKMLAQPLLYMSAYFEKNKDTYRDYLLKVSQQGAWDDWVRFFLKGIVVQCADAVVRSDRLLRLREEYRSRIQSRRASTVVLQLVDSLFVSLGITAKRAAKTLDVSVQAAQNNINRLVDAGMLEEITGNERNRFYYAREVANVAYQDQDE